MKKLNLLSKLLVAGAVTASGIALAVPQKAEAATAYSYSEANFDVGITATFEIPSFSTETADSAELRFPMMTDGNADITDAAQACVTTNMMGPGACLIGQNSFIGFIPNINTDGPVGQANADYARSDVEIISASVSDSVSDVEGINAAETFVDDKNPKTIGDADAEWEYGTGLFTVEDGDQLTIDIEGYYDLIVQINDLPPKGQGFVESEYEFGIFLDGLNLLEFANDNGLVNGPDGQFGATTLELNNPLVPVDRFQFSEAISRTNANGREVLGQQLDCNGNPICSFTVTFGDDEGEIPVGTYDLTIESLEEVTARVETVPEPATMLGLLAVGGLGFGLKRKKQS